MQLREMNPSDLDTVIGIEQSVHTHPWTRGNFTDAINSNNICKIAEINSETVGYVILMPALDEIELLYISIAHEHQRKGLGRLLLTEAIKIARSSRRVRMLLEVRPSNLAALRLYCATGFTKIGLRRDYYIADNGREDAIVMECLLDSLS